MAQTGSASEARLDLLLGKSALERGLVTPAQLREALSEQALEVSHGRKIPRPIGWILVSKKVLADTQVLNLTREIEQIIAREVQDRKNDAFVAQILIDADMVAAKHVEECAGVQAEMFREGGSPIPRLGDFLVERGYATPKDIEEAMMLREAMVATCAKCGTSSSLTGESAPDRCPDCDGPLEHSIPQELLASVSSVVIPAVPEETEETDPKRLGKYVIERVLGQGGCGVVYLATDTSLNRKVALKLMHRGSGSSRRESSQEVDRFVREAMVSAKLRHPNIVSIFDAGVVDGQHYIAMEYIEGLSMAQWRKAGSITIRQQVRLLRDVALAVHHAHEQGVTHRDLKPQNVMVDVKIKPYVTDFGLAKNAGGKDMSASLTVEGAILGTPAYMSPEQAKGRKTVGKRSDIWSLGIMLYEILTGRTPFKGSSPIETLMKVLKDPVPPPSQMVPALLSGPLNRPLEAIVMKALQKEPGDRYTSAKDFAGDLTKWLKGDEVKVVARRPRAALKWAIGAVAGGLVILALVALMGSSGPRVSKNLLRGEEYLKAGEWDAARQLFEHVLSREPGNERAKRGLAIATAQHDAQREIDELRRELERAQRNLSEDERRRLEERLRAVEQRARASPTPAPQR